MNADTLIQLSVKLNGDSDRMAIPCQYWQAAAKTMAGSGFCQVDRKIVPG